MIGSAQAAEGGMDEQATTRLRSAVADPTRLALLRFVLTESTASPSALSTSDSPRARSPSSSASSPRWACSAGAGPAAAPITGCASPTWSGASSPTPDGSPPGTGRSRGPDAEQSPRRARARRSGVHLGRRGAPRRHDHAARSRVGRWCRGARVPGSPVRRPSCATYAGPRSARTARTAGGGLPGLLTAGARRGTANRAAAATRATARAPTGGPTARPAGRDRPGRTAGRGAPPPRRPAPARGPTAARAARPSRRGRGP